MFCYFHNIYQNAEPHENFKIPRHSWHEKSLQRQHGVGPSFTSQEKSGCVPTDNVQTKPLQTDLESDSLFPETVFIKIPGFFVRIISQHPDSERPDTLRQEVILVWATSGLPPPPPCADTRCAGRPARRPAGLPTRWRAGPPARQRTGALARCM